MTARQPELGKRVARSVGKSKDPKQRFCVRKQKSRLKRMAWRWHRKTHPDFFKIYSLCTSNAFAVLSSFLLSPSLLPSPFLPTTYTPIRSLTPNQKWETAVYFLLLQNVCSDYKYEFMEQIRESRGRPRVSRHHIFYLYYLCLLHYPLRSVFRNKSRD